MFTTPVSVDPHAQLRALYCSLLTHQERFDEFKQLLAMYDIVEAAPPVRCGDLDVDLDLDLDLEPEAAARVRTTLNERIRGWVGGCFDGLSAAQVLQWRAIVVEERLNVSLSPWKESNIY
jgi:hypothetical protein